MNVANFLVDFRCQVVSVDKDKILRMCLDGSGKIAACRLFSGKLANFFNGVLQLGTEKLDQADKVLGKYRGTKPALHFLLESSI